MGKRKSGGAVGRRDFMRATSGMLIGSAIVGCKEVGAPDAGTVRVTVTGLTAGFTSAGTVRVTGGSLTEPTNVDLGTQSSGELTVSAGTYTVLYTPPAGYSMTAGQSNLLEVVVTAAEVTLVSLGVSVASGTLRLTVSGLAAGAAAGGTAQALRTDLVGQSPISLTVPGTGTVDRSVEPGNYSVTYSPPGGFALATTNPQTVVVAGNATGTVAFTVNVTAPPPAVIFHSDFGTSIGADAASVRDSSKALPWNIQGGQGLEVISAAGLDFPTTNVLRVTSVQASLGYSFLRRSGLPIPAVGESRFYRWYMRVTTPNGLEDPESHPVQDGNAGSQCNWLFHVYHDAETPGMWRPQFRPNGNVNSFPIMRFTGPALPKHTTFRFEMHFHRTGSMVFQMHARIYDATGALIHGDSSWTNDNSTSTLAANPTFNMRDPLALDGLNAGCNGIAGAAPPFPFVYGYQSGFAVGSQDWMGPYSGGI